MINWIAEVTHDDPDAYQNMGWYRQTSVDDFIHHFEDWKYDWLDVPALIRGSDVAYENPMIDRDPIPSWVDGPVALARGCRPRHVSNGVKWREPSNY